MSTWRYANASVIGTSHEKSGKPCQDSSACEVLNDIKGEQVLVAVASDGAGSAQCSDMGSALACSLFMDELRAYLETGNEIKALTKDFYEEWIVRFQSEIHARATAMELPAREFACTFLSTVISNETAVFAQIGDGAIVVASPDEIDTYTWEFWPQQGEYENTTYFVTETRAREKLQFSIHTGKVTDEVSLFTDGLQRLALHYQSQSAHTPFFRPFFNALRAQVETKTDKFVTSLAAYLSSNPINDRTDDDKTLILATRRSPSSQNAKI